MIDYKIGDCQELIKDLPDNYVNLAILDPPYYKVVKDEWDHQWKTLEEYIDWLESVLIDVKRVLKDNGSLYIFGDDRTIAYVQVMADRHFNFLNSLVWYKINNISIKGANISSKYATVSERILFYETQEFRKYVTCEREKIKHIPYRKINELIGVCATGGGMANNVLNVDGIKWRIPCKEMYQSFRNVGIFKRRYEDIVKPFNYHKGMYEVFDIPIIGGKENTEHSTTKPKELIKRIIEVSSNPGDLVLDPLLGSGTTLIACRETGRDCIGFEKDPKYEPIIRKRAMLDTPELSSYL